MSLTRKGSPPRVRGKVVAGARQTTAERITPACAGKRRRLRQIIYLTEDHPRVCGEKSLLAHGRQPQKGSPPRVRGKGDDYGRLYT